MLRGGSWNNDDQDNLLSSNRNNNTPTNRNDNNGFRVVLVGGSARKVSKGFGEVPDGDAPCPAGAKRDHLTRPSAPQTGKIRGAGRGL